MPRKPISARASSAARAAARPPSRSPLRACAQALSQLGAEARDPRRLAGDQLDDADAGEQVGQRERVPDPAGDLQALGAHAPRVVDAAGPGKQEHVPGVRGDARLLAEREHVAAVALRIPNGERPADRGEAFLELAAEAARDRQQHVGLERGVRVAGGLGDAP